MTNHRLETKEMGDISYTERDTYDFDHGLIGLPDLKHFVLVEKNEQFAILQSIDDPDISFMVTEPDNWELHMEIELASENIKHLDYQQDDELWIMYIAHMPEGHPEKMSMNLHGPLVINLRNHKGVQQVLHARNRFDNQESMCLSTDDSKHHLGHLQEHGIA